MLEKAIDFFEKEYEETESYLGRGENCIAPEKVVEHAIHSCLGVAMFVQLCGVEFTDINPHYNKVLEKLHKLLDK